MSAWWTLVIDQGNGGGVTRFYCGYIYHGREEFPCAHAARAYVRGIVEADCDDSYREVVNLTRGESFRIVRSVTRDEFLAQTRASLAAG